MANKLWPFTTPANYVYDSGKIEIIGGLVKLKQATLLDVYANWHLNESSGAVAADSSGNGRDGTLENMENEDWKPGKLNNCLEFDGVNECVNFGNIANFERTDPFSLEIWFKTGDQGEQDIFNRMMAAQPYTGWIIYMTSGGKIQYFLVNNMTGANYIQVSAIGNFADSAWHQVIVTYDGSSTAAGIHIYIDGNDKPLQITRDALSASIQNAEDCRIAARDRPTVRYTGQIDEVVIYNKELSQAEVTARWNSGDGIEEISGGGYPTDKPTIRPYASWHTFGLTQLTAFAETLGGGNQGSIGYQLSEDDGETWLYWNGTAWIVATDDDYNDLATVQANIGSFPINEDKIIFKAFLISDGSQKVELSSIEITADKIIEIIQPMSIKVRDIKDETDEIPNIVVNTNLIQAEIIDKPDDFKADVSGLASQITADGIKAETDKIPSIKLEADKIQPEIIDKKDEFKADLSGLAAEDGGRLQSVDAKSSLIQGILVDIKIDTDKIGSLKTMIELIEQVEIGEWKIENDILYFLDPTGQITIASFQLHYDNKGNVILRERIS